MNKLENIHEKVISSVRFISRSVTSKTGKSRLSKTILIAVFIVFIILVGPVLSALSSSVTVSISGTMSTSALGTFGLTTIGSSYTGRYGDRATVSQFSLTQYASVTSITAYLSDGSGNTIDNVAYGIYSDVAGVPSVLLGQTQQFTVGSNGAWYTASFSSAINLSPGTYWLGFVSISSDYIMYYYNSGGSQYFSPHDGYFPNPFNIDGSDGNYKISIFATYVPIPPHPADSNVAISTTIQSETCEFSAQWSESGSTLSNYIFSWNGTGKVTNDTQQAFSSDWSNVTKTLPSQVGLTISWQIFASDAQGSWGSTGLQTFTTTANMELHIDGQYMKDINNNIVVLHGVNAFAFTDYAGGYWGGSGHASYAAYIGDVTKLNAELDAIQSWGSNCIRLTTAAQYWIDDTGNARQIYEDFANRCAQRGIYVIIEGWNIVDSGLQVDVPYPPYNPIQDPSGSLAIIGSEQDYINYMTSEAQVLKDYPNVIFGMWNEPSFANTTVEANWFNVVQRAITSMRSTGCNNVILVQDGFGSHVSLWGPITLPPDTPYYIGGQIPVDWIVNYPLTGSNIAYSTHLYDSIQTDQDYGYYPGYGSYDVSYNNVILGFQYMWFQYVTQTLGKCLVIGEIGCLESLGSENGGLVQQQEYATYTNYLHALNDLNIGYVGWTFRAGVPYPLISSDYPNYTPTQSGLILQQQIAAYK